MGEELKSLLSDKAFVLELLKDPEGALQMKGISLSGEQLDQLKQDAERHLQSFGKAVLLNAQIQDTDLGWPNCPRK